jgi:hypothetical protein
MTYFSWKYAAALPDHLVRPTMGARDPELETAKGLIAAPPFHPPRPTTGTVRSLKKIEVLSGSSPPARHSPACGAWHPAWRIQTRALPARHARRGWRPWGDQSGLPPNVWRCQKPSMLKFEVDISPLSAQTEEVSDKIPLL